MRDPNSNTGDPAGRNRRAVGVVDYIADHVAVMQAGRIVEQGEAYTVLGWRPQAYTQHAAGGGAAGGGLDLIDIGCCKQPTICGKWPESASSTITRLLPQLNSIPGRRPRARPQWIRHFPTTKRRFQSESQIS